MRGKYNMMDWELDKWKHTLALLITKWANDVSHQEDFTNLDICPANIETALEALGWEHDEQDENGWQNDCWIYMSNPDYDFRIIIYYCGYTFELKVYRSDWEDNI